MGRKNSKKKKNRNKESAGHTLKGVLDITRSGMGFVILPESETDILIRPSDFNTALHGDTVRIKLKSGGGRRLQGEVIEVIHRKRTEFIGKLEVNKAGKDGKSFAFFIADMDKPMPDIFIPFNNLNGAEDNDRVVVRLLNWENGDKRPLGEVVAVMDAENSNDAAMKEIILGAGFALNFSDEAMEEAARIPDIISENEIKNRKDIRSILTFTIDPVDAKDFDDALSIRKLDNGMHEIGVHIADVSHYLAQDSVLDQEAYERATSVYLPDRVNPMLPEHISNFLCSLRPQEDKLTFSAIFQMNEKGEVKQYWLGKTIIHSDRRFTNQVIMLQKFIY